jgi:hypothetical protein
VFAGATRRDVKGRGLSNYLGRRAFAKLIGWRIFLFGKPGGGGGIWPQSLESLKPPEEEQQKEARKRRCFCIISC